MLNDRRILDRLSRSDRTAVVITPLIDPRQIQSASVDLRLGFHFKSVRNNYVSALDPLRQAPADLARSIERYTVDAKIELGEPFYIHPGEFVLGTTYEYVRLPSDIAASLDGRSSLGRLGITVHSTAGFIDPGFSGRITYEMRNEGSSPVALYAGMRVAQLCFFELDDPAIAPYGSTEVSKYKQQLTTTSSRWYKDPDLLFLRELAARQRGNEDQGSPAEAARSGPQSGVRDPLPTTPSAGKDAPR